MEGSGKLLFSPLEAKAMFVAFQPQRVEKRNGEITYGAFSPDGKNLLLSSGDTLWLYNVEDEAVLMTGEIPLTGRISFSPDCTKIIVYNRYYRRAFVLFAETLEVMYLLHDCGMACFNPDGTKIAILYGPCGVAICDSANGNLLLRSTEFRNQNHLTHIAFHPDGARLLIMTGKGGIFLWNLLSGEVNQLTVCHKYVPPPYHFACFSPDGTKLAIPYTINSVFVLDLEANKGPIYRISDRHIAAVAFSPDSKYFVFASDYTDIEIRNLINGRKEGRISTASIAINTISFSSDGSKLLVTGNSGNVLIFRVMW